MQLTSLDVPFNFTNCGGSLQLALTVPSYRTHSAAPHHTSPPDVTGGRVNTASRRHRLDTCYAVPDSLVTFCRRRRRRRRRRRAVGRLSPVLTAPVSAVPAPFATVRARPGPFRLQPPLEAVLRRHGTGRDALGRSQTGPEQR